MLKKILSLFVLLFSTALYAQQSGLSVISYSPKNNMYSTSMVAINVTFNKPVIKLSDSSQFGEMPCPIELSPAAAGNCRWTGTQTVTFEAKTLMPSTEYTVTVLDNFKSEISGEKLGKNFTWTFRTPRIYVSTVAPYKNERWVNLNPTIFLIFNQGINPQTSQNKIHLLDDKNNPVSFKAVRPSKEALKEAGYSYYDPERVIALTLYSYLQMNSEYKIKVEKGVMGEQGTLGTEAEFNSSFFTFPPLTFKKVKMPQCLPGALEIFLSNPVEMSALLDHITISPEVKTREITEDQARFTGNLYSSENSVYFSLNMFDFEPEKKYSVTLKKGLKDIYGNVLESSVTEKIKYPAYCQNLTTKGGFGVMESYLPARYPVTLINVHETYYNFEKLSTPADFISFYHSKDRYCNRNYTTSGNLYKFNIARNKTHHTYFDLDRLLDNPKGFVYGEVINKREQSYSPTCKQPSFSNITDLGLTFKTSPDNSLIWVTDLKEGKPAAGKKVEIFDSNGNSVWAGTSDKNGFALADGWKDFDLSSYSRWEKPVLYAAAYSDGGDAIISSNWTEGIEPWRFNINYEWSPQVFNYRAAMFFDRDILKPGEKVRLKGVVRKLENGDWNLASEFKNGTLTVSDSRGKEMLNETLGIDQRFGTFETVIEIPSSSPTGHYSVNFQTKNGDLSASDYKTFRVETVKEATFKVTLNTDKDNYFVKDKAEITVDGAYMFGGAMGAAPAALSVRYANSSYTNKNFEGYNFGGNYEEYDSNYTTLEGSLDDKGRYETKVEIPSFSTPKTMYIEAGLTAPDRQRLFARRSVSVHPADFYLGLKTPEGYYFEVNKPYKTHVIAVAPDTGKMVEDVKGTVKITRKEYFSVRKTGVNGRLQWVNEENVTEVGEYPFTIGKKGYDFELTPSESGSYVIQFKASDSKGREVVNSINVFVSGKGGGYWEKSDDDIIKLLADKKSYKVGDKAKIMVQSPYESAIALVTVERENIMEKFTVNLKGGSDSFTLPIKDEYVPNAFISVVVIQGRSGENKYDDEGLDIGKPQTKIGYANITVETETRKIKTKVTTDKDTYQPGETVKIDVHTTVKGNNISANTAIFVVDEGILALTGYSTPDLLKEFYGPRALGVGTVDSRIYVIGQRSYGEKGENSGGGGGEDNKLGGVDLRSNFDAAPYWNTVITDAKGKASVSFKLPDNLTKFRVMAVAVGKKEFGSGDTNITVNKPVMIKPSLPRFARLGDAFKCGVVVYNRDAKEGITVSGEVTGGIAMIGESVIKEEIAKGGFKEILWDCQAVSHENAQFTFKAVSGKNSDGLLWPVTINNIEKYQTLATSGIVDDKQVKEGMKRPSSSYIPFANNRAEFVLSSTALVDIRGGILYLLSYPYGCLEQKMSKVFPIIAAQTIVDDFNLGDITKLKESVQKVLNDLSLYQNASGGFGYWTSRPQADPYITVYTLEVAHMAKAKGYKIDEAVINKAVKWLESYMAGGYQQAFAYPYSVSENKTVKAYASYVLALYGKKGTAAFSKLYADRGQLTLMAKAHLLKTAKLLGKNDEVKVLGDDLMNYVKVAPTTMHFEIEERMPWIHGSNLTVTAVILDAMLQGQNGFPGDEKTVRWILKQISPEGNWQTTAANAAVFRALNSYYTIKESVEPDFTAEIKINSVKAWTGGFKGRDLNTKTAVVPFDNLFNSKGESNIIIRKDGKGRLYYNMYQIYAPLKLDTPVNSGFTVTRTITPLYGEKGAALKAGERATITLTVTSNQDRPFVVVEDFLPAGLEIVDSSLAVESQRDADVSLGYDYEECEDCYEQEDDGYYSGEYYVWGELGRNEKYDDRIAIFADYLTKGTHTYKYVVQATMPGVYTFPAAWASQMYEPENFGRNTTQTIEIK
ncbi:Large extracellular alpha-helical protein [Elusimicrobium minutum Pei191]|uniref:Large extracellular alpha-helical protein n=1 Tax=Elusimicrobium minutum (strain Pei191) TaxID=445932 RepID=B2KC66_ELUMP|nr:Ig-like domain-containing alpha-2-macroglobulin family protein [Elusimicrobium minutum]ACC98193.1 Large extracellular alpha-helical protein [Elusimicrobium minutum Pei191]